MKVKSESEVAQSCPTLSGPMDYSLSGSSVHGILQARVLEWGAIVLSPDGTSGKESTCPMHKIQEMQVRSLGREDHLEEEMATYSTILAWRIPMVRGAWWATVHGGCKESDMTEQLHFHQ